MLMGRYRSLYYALDPFIVADESAEAIKYLTEGVLVRINRLTQNFFAELG